MTRSRRFDRWIAFAIAISSPCAALAVPLVHGDFPAATVDYLSVQEESFSDPGVEFLGAPTVSEDSLGFNPLSFAASSSGGSATGDNSVEKTSKLEFTVASRGKQGIQSLSFVQAGSTTLAGLKGDAQSAVQASITIDIAEMIDAAGQRHPLDLLATTWIISFLPKDQYSLNVDGAGSLSWTGSLDVALQKTLAEQGIDGMASKVNISADFALSATSTDGTSAFIQLMDSVGAASRIQAPSGLSITADTVAVPEPMSLALAFVSAAIGFLRPSRRRSMSTLTAK